MWMQFLDDVHIRIMRFLDLQARLGRITAIYTAVRYT
jgi:hypothetical protein